MMDNIDKIIELLEKEVLSAEERNEFNKLLAATPGANDLVSTYNGLRKAYGKYSHISDTMLGEYVLYKQNMLEDKRTMILLERKFEDHLRNCEQCTTSFKALNEEYEDVDSFLTRSIKDAASEQDKQEISKGFLYKIRPVKLAFASAAMLIIIYFGMFTASSLLIPEYKQYAIAEDERDFYNTRGRTSEAFQRSLAAIDNKEYSLAIKFLEEDIETNKNENSIFYSHFILGVTYIQSSESSFLGTFKSYNRQKVEQGIDNLKKSVELNNSGRYDNLNFDAHYFIGKAYILIDDFSSAEDHLEVVVKNRGSYYKKAEELLDKINKR